MVVGVCARSPNAERLALLIGLCAIPIAFLGWFLIGAFAVPIAVLLGGALGFAMLSPLPLEIGSDGMAFVGFRKSFISYAEIEAIEETSDATLLRCTGGRQLRLVSTQRKRLDPATLDQLRALVLRHWRNAQPAIVLMPRAGQSLAAWVESIRSSDATSDRGSLLATVEDPALPAELRAVAALLLRNGFTQEERLRVVAVAQATVAVPLRKVLDRLTGMSVPETEILSAIEAIDPAPGRHAVFRTLRSRSAAFVRRQVSRVLSACERTAEITERVIDELTAISAGPRRVEAHVDDQALTLIRRPARSSR